MILFAVGGFMNFASLVYFGFHGKRCRSNYRYFIAHLSFADLLCCLVAPFFFIVRELSDGKWILGEFACKFVHPIGRISGSVSAWILCGMTYERYRAFTNPFHKLHKKSIQVFLVVVWVLSIIALIFSFFRLSLEKGKCKTDDSMKTLIYELVKSNVKITLPSIIMTGLYIKLKLFLTGQNKRRENKLQSKMKTEKSERMILYSVVTYQVCVLPILVLYFYTDLPILLHEKSTIKLFNLFHWLLILFYANSVINVFIYAGKFRDFRMFIFEKLAIVRQRYRRHREMRERDSANDIRRSNVLSVSKF